MTAAGALTHQEIRIIDALAQKDIWRETATLAVVMWSRRHVRPEPELLELISNYPLLDRSENRRRALQDARARAWVVDVQSKYGGSAILQVASDLDELLGTLVPDIKAEFTELRRNHVSVRVLGHMGEPEVFDSYSTRLREAQSDVVLPAIMTTPNLSAAEVLKERAQAGVKIRVLLATADLAGEIRGAKMIGTAKERLEGWKVHAKGRRNFQIRVSKHRSDLRDASSVLIDGKILRYDVYDDAVERTTDGTMIEVGRPTNLSRMFQERFDDAWARARPLGLWPTVGWAIRRWWWVGIAAAGVVVVVTIRTQHPTATALILGGLIGYIVNKIDPLLKGAKKWWERQRA